MKVLLADPDAKRVTSLVGSFESSGFGVDVAQTADELYCLCDLSDYDLLIVSLELPDCRGVEVIKRLRRKLRSSRIITMCSCTSAKERVEALNTGADDCLPAAVPFEELLARCRAILRRPTQIVGPTYEVGNLRLDTSVSAVTIELRDLRLPRREVALLELLMRDHARPVPRRKLEHALFRLDNEVTPNALEAVISRLRRRLKESASSVNVIARRGFGYSLADCVSQNNLSGDD